LWAPTAVGLSGVNSTLADGGQPGSFRMMILNFLDGLRKSSCGRGWIAIEVQEAELTR
jgi:hypothetical protein